jgi:hypothetical protein
MSQEFTWEEAIRQTPSEFSFEDVVTSQPSTPRPQGRAERNAPFALNLASGLVRGAGSIGATLLRRQFEDTPQIGGLFDRALTTLVPAAGPISNVLSAGGIRFDTAEENAERRRQMTRGLASLGADTDSLAFGAGKLGGEIAGTIAVGGPLGRGLMAVAPTAAPLATALSTGGFRAGAATRTGDIAARAAGGATVGGLSTFAAGEDAGVGAGVGAAVGVAAPVAMRQLAKGAGWLFDALSGQLGMVKAGQIARLVAGGDLGAIKAANVAARQGETSGQAAAGVDNATWAALDNVARKENTGSWWTRRALGQAAEDSDTLNRLAGGANVTESLAVQDASKKALNQLTTPMRETELAAAGVGNRQIPALQRRQERFAAAAAAQVEDVRRFTDSVRRAELWADTWAPSSMGGNAIDLGRSKTPRQYNFASELAQAAEQRAGSAAESSQLFGEIARDAKRQLQTLERLGIRPLRSEEIITPLRQRLADPDIATNRDAAAAINRVNAMLDDWTNKFGFISPDALYAIRKNGVTSVIKELNPTATEDTRRKLAQSVLSEVTPLIDNAIERAGGTGWRNYLKTFEQGMRGIEQQRMANVARELYRTGDKQGFVDLVRGNAPDKVEDIFGPGNRDFIQLMGGQRPKSSAREFSRIAENVERELKLARQAPEGGIALSNIISDESRRFLLPPVFSQELTIARAGLRDFEGKVNRATIQALERGMQSGMSANQMLSFLPASERIKVLQVLRNSDRANPILQRGITQGTSGLFSGQQQ